MKVLHSAVLLLIVAVAVWQIWSLVRRDREARAAHICFFDEVEAKLGKSRSISLGTGQVYDKMRSHVFKKYQKSLELPDDAENDTDKQPQDSWLRRLPPGTADTLFKALVRRAMEVIPHAKALQSEITQKSYLFQKSLISEKQWKHVMDSHDAVTQEVEFIGAEACRLDERFDGGLVFHLAAKQLAVANMSKGDVM